MRIALHQNRDAGTLEANLAKSIRAIEAAGEAGADLILFPEVHLTEFFAQYPGKDVSAYERSIDSDAVDRFRRCCKENGIMAVPNIYLRESNNCYDASILIGKDGEIIGIQKMVHVAYAEQFYETDYYTPSDDGFHVFKTPFGNIGVVVCFDRHYPESIRTEALMGADIVLIPTANTLQEPMELFEQELRVQAFQNSVFIAMANRVGKEDAMDFSGESIIVSPEGETLFKADDREGLICFDVGDIRNASKLRMEKPYTSLRRPECYL